MFSEEIKKALNREIPSILDIVLHGTFEDIVKHLKMLNDPPTSYDNTNDNRIEDNKEYCPPSKKSKVDNHYADVILTKLNNFVQDIPTIPVERRFPQSVALSWNVNLSKCIDASPVIVSSNGTTRVLIGSHSKRFCCIDFVSGAVVWERELCGRIEASPSVDPTGSRVLVGCYSGAVYCLNVTNGATLWLFSAGAEVKSSAVVDPLTGYVYFGSHDKYLYCVSREGALVWKFVHSGGSIFSTVCLFEEKVFAACLRGSVKCYNKISGEVLWSYEISSPVFGTLVPYSRGVIAVSVDHHVYALTFEGSLAWSFETSSQIFANPRVCNFLSQEIIAIANNAGDLILMSPEGEVLGRHSLEGRVVATPFLYCVQGPCSAVERPYVTVDQLFSAVESPCNTVDKPCSAVEQPCGAVEEHPGLCSVVATCSGKVYMLRHSAVEGSQRGASSAAAASRGARGLLFETSVAMVEEFSKEIFSSPLVYDGCLVICGRDDTISCYKLL